MSVATSPGRCAATRAASSASAASPACSPSSSRRRQETIAGRSPLAAASAISPLSKSTTVCRRGAPPRAARSFARRLGVVGDRYRRLGVVEHVGALLGGVGDEDAGGNRSRRDRGEIGDGPLRPVRREDGEPRPRHHPEPHEAGCRAEDLGTIVAPRGRLPPGGGSVRQRRPISELRCSALERRDHRAFRGSRHRATTLTSKRRREKLPPPAFRTGRRLPRSGRRLPRLRRSARSRR